MSAPTLTRPSALDYELGLSNCYHGIMSETTTEARTWRIPAQHEAKFDQNVAHANNRLAKHGIEARFVFAREDILVPSVDDKDVLEEWVIKTALSAPTIALGDYVFVAALVGEEHGMVVHTAPNQTLVGWDRPAGDDQTCDHCAVKRDRKKLYVVRNIHTGEVTQVGSTCIELYLGIEVKGLWALEYLDGLDEVARSLSEGGASGGELIATVDRVIGLAWAYSDQGRKYVSVAKAQEWERTATGQSVRSHLYGPPQRHHYRGEGAEADYQADLADYQARSATAAELVANTELLAAIKASAETLNADSDYGQNMAVILKGESVRSRNIGIVASIVAVYARQQNLRAEAAAKPATEGFLAPVKDAKGKASRVKGIELTLTRVRYLDGQYGTTTILVGTAATGHAVEWFASGHIEADAGDVLTLDASIKAHKAAGSDQYTRVDTTVLTRGKITQVVTPGEAEAPATTEAQAEVGTRVAFKGQPGYGTGTVTATGLTTRAGAAAVTVTWDGYSDEVLTPLSSLIAAPHENAEVIAARSNGGFAA